jgi:hypothetical protein
LSWLGSRDYSRNPPWLANNDTVQDSMDNVVGEPFVEAKNVRRALKELRAQSWQKEKKRIRRVESTRNIAPLKHYRRARFLILLSHFSGAFSSSLESHLIVFALASVATD